MDLLMNLVHCQRFFFFFYLFMSFDNYYDGNVVQVIIELKLLQMGNHQISFFFF